MITFDENEKPTIKEMTRKIIFQLAMFYFSLASYGQNPLHHFSEAVETRFSSSQPVINYTIKVDSSNLSFIEIEMLVRNTQDTFQVAMAAHQEYDDRYWRFVENFHIETPNNNGSILREDSALWRIVAPGGKAILHYMIHLPAPVEQRAAWRPFLSTTGGLIGGMQTFMYIVGATLAPSQVVLKLPKGWSAATGLEPTSDSTIFFAPDVAVLVDCPVLIGRFKNWRFTIDAVPHSVIYWQAPGSKSPDSTLLVSSIKKIVQQATGLFGRIPYREYSFLLQDKSYGALEHSNSVTLGIPADQFDKNFSDYILEISHEYFHTWNLVRIRPAEWGDVSYKTPKLSRGLWWGEGLTMFYADLLIRRAGIMTEEPSRLVHLENIIRRYFMNSGNYLLSPEVISMSENAPPGFTGDYIGSPHVQGELLGAMLDINIRYATNDKYSMDDVMRKMLENFSGKTGYKGEDIERMIHEVCKCDVHTFFEQYIRGKKQIDFNKYLQLIGVHMNLSWEQATDENGKQRPDLRIFARQTPAGSMSLGIIDPLGSWGKASLHSNDLLVSMNGKFIKRYEDFYAAIRPLKIGDTISVVVKRSSGIFKTDVYISGYKVPVVHLLRTTPITDAQQKLFETWDKGQ